MTAKEICKEIYYWCSLIVPPCLILPLAAIPPDLPSAWLWGIACIAGLYSAFSILYSVFIHLISKTKLCRKETDGKHNKTTRSSWIIRPALTLLFIILSVYSVKTSLDTAKKFAVSKAIEIQKICKAGKCPVLIEGWIDRGEHNLYRSQIMAGDIAKYAIGYRVSDNVKEFEIYVRINIDTNSRIASGGTEKELTFLGRTPEINKQ